MVARDSDFSIPQQLVTQAGGMDLTALSFVELNIAQAAVVLRQAAATELVKA